jgi:GNAT superfamily N-acetyltransferase
MGARTIHQIATPEQLEPFRVAGALPLVTPAELTTHAPDVHAILLEAGEPVGRCSLWWRQTPLCSGQRLGAIGHYAVRDNAAARTLLRHACEQLGAHGCTLAVAPMDGTTWRRYRFVVERGSELAFFLEPDNPDGWPADFLTEGFTPLARYTSALNPDLTRADNRAEHAAANLAGRGIRIRALDPGTMERELHRIYALSAISFRNNFLYSCIAEEEFTDQYRQILPHVRHELVLLAEEDGELVGFLFALPDLLQARRGERVDTIIFKTIAVLPARSHAGLGSLLVDRGHAVARDLGYRRAIHALMHEENNSRNISSRTARTMRRYALFARSLAP